MKKVFIYQKFWGHPCFPAKDKETWETNYDFETIGEARKKVREMKKEDKQADEIWEYKIVVFRSTKEIEA